MRFSTTMVKSASTIEECLLPPKIGRNERYISDLKQSFQGVVAGSLSMLD